MWSTTMACDSVFPHEDKPAIVRDSLQLCQITGDHNGRGFVLLCHISYIITLLSVIVSICLRI